MDEINIYEVLLSLHYVLFTVVCLLYAINQSLYDIINKFYTKQNSSCVVVQSLRYMVHFLRAVAKSFYTLQLLDIRRKFYYNQY